MKEPVRSFTFRITCAIIFVLSSILARSSADELKLLWQIGPDDARAYLTGANTERGIAYNPATGHVLLVSRTGGLNVYILDGETGEELGTLNLGGDVTGGAFPLSHIGVTPDGVIYAANLTTGSTTAPFRVYRWGNEASTEPIVVYEGDPGEGQAPRWGDSFDVRGSGTDTQLIAGAGGTSNIGALFTTTDGTNFTTRIITNMAANSVAFGSGNRLWIKRSGAALQELSFDPATGAGTILRTIPSADVTTASAPIGVNVSSNWLGIIVLPAGPDELRVYDISTDPLTLLAQESFGVDNPNANAAGSVEWHEDRVFALDTENGLFAYRLEITVVPTIASQPASVNILEGGYATLRAGVTGGEPLAFQWRRDEVNLPGATNSALVLTNVTLDRAGDYSLFVTNSTGSIVSSNATVTISPSVRSSRAVEVWKLPPGSRPYIGEANNERGLAYNPSNGHLLIVSRTGGLNIHVLDAATGADLHKLQVPTEVVTGGTFALNMISVADDGAVYGANLVTGGTGFKIYRWANDSSNTIPTVAYSGDDGSGLRLGDTFDARGSGPNTQLVAAQNQTTVALQAEPPTAFMVYTTTDGLTFTANRFEVLDAPSGSGRLGLTFGGENTIYTKAPAHPLRHFSFDLTNAVAALLNVHDNVNGAGVGPIAYDPASKLLAGIANVSTTPDNLELYQFDVSTNCVNGECPPTPTLLDQDFFSTDNANANGTGAVDFGGEMVFALDTNNGLLALKINPAPSGGDVQLGNPALAANSFSFTLTGSPLQQYLIQSTTNFQSWIDGQNVTTGADGTATVSVAVSGTHRFYRAAARMVDPVP